ncbi:tetratricopeptide repeat protein [Blastopirellula retiformator]|uniref:Tetratricopeptide repeat protein n=1 Tax=Blastopirellula retiformator TaxID=2527970 RepID=A0A5C5V710_9BACT|nr:hypothetical protein [Blastopirellula retiformator]TWT34358.1 Tetratricopeptide repeat protein [Blastopirellula retiformator]
MNAIAWITNCFSKRDRATTLYKRGMAKAKLKNHQGAIDDYTSALKAPDGPASLRGMILYNRGIVYVAAGMAKNGADDLNAVLSMDEIQADVKAAAKRKLAKIQSRTGKRNA